MILYFTYWFPSAYRGRVISTLFVGATGRANAVGSIVSAAIHSAWTACSGLKGGNGFLSIEASSAILCAFVVIAVMTDRPEIANWLAPDEKNWLKTKLGEERPEDRERRPPDVLKAYCDPRVLALSVMYFMSVTAKCGIVFFMPQIIKGIGLSNMMTGFVSSVPYIISTVGLIIWGWSSDRKPERRWHLIVALDTCSCRSRVCRLDRSVLAGRCSE